MNPMGTCELFSLYPRYYVDSKIGIVLMWCLLYRKGFFHFAQATLPLLLDSVSSSPHPPSLIITGATASLRGSANMSSFASGKFALRATGQSLAREFGPQGVHIAHAIIDGVIDIPRTKDWPVNGGVPDGKIDSDAVS
jgi:NAD(P)-dependent dehydrogenase (short-subunit alcohol dehydrogenase family)